MSVEAKADLLAVIICIIAIAVLLSVFIPAVDKEQDYTEQRLDSQLSKTQRSEIIGRLAK